MTLVKALQHSCTPSFTPVPESLMPPKGVTSSRLFGEAVADALEEALVVAAVRPHVVEHRGGLAALEIGAVAVGAELRVAVGDGAGALLLSVEGARGTKEKREQRAGGEESRGGNHGGGGSGGIIGHRASDVQWNDGRRGFAICEFRFARMKGRTTLSRGRGA